ncbi:MAG TPA: gamma-glutamyltransferase, partial [Candidatus Dormibacteraeota bacterium]|nr:gamma-glutamyltransferase [Candidatus Dormibacteraeota bacterium]
LASLAGIDVLRDGGSAGDAAIAANLVLGVVWPHMCGPGGDLFAQVWSSADRKLYGLNASGRAGSGMSGEAYRARGVTRMPIRGALSITVPGAVDGWFSLHQRFGRLDMQRIARDAIHYARDGFRVTPFTAGAIRAGGELLAKLGDGADVFLPGGRAPSAGDVLVHADLADTLELIAREGASAMYHGPLGERIVDFLAANGAGLTSADFAAQRSEWVEPVSVNYRGVDVFQIPPNSQGIALLEMLNMLDGVDLTAWDPYSAESVHQLVERKKLAFADRDAHVADPASVDVPLGMLLDRPRSLQRAAQISSRAAPSRPRSVGRSVDGDTIYLCAADRDGNVVSLIQSLFAAFGSGVHVPGTGITMHNRGFGFTLLEGHPNELAPGKRPMHTLMPGMAFRAGQPWLAFGTRGADGQPQTGLQVLNGLLDFDLDLQAAVEAPRWAHGAPGGRFPASALVVESRFGDALAEDLAARGDEVMLADAVDPVMGTVQMIQVDQSRGCFVASTDPRGDGVALAV